MKNKVSSKLMKKKRRIHLSTGRKVPEQKNENNIVVERTTKRNGDI